MKQFGILIAFVCYISSTFGQKVNPNYLDGQLYFKFKNNYTLNVTLADGGIIPLEQLGELKSVFAKFGVTHVQRSFYFSDNKDLQQTIRIYFSKANEINAFREALQLYPFADFTEPVKLLRKSLTPNDMGASNFNTGRWHLPKVKADSAFDISTGSTSIKIAIVDDAILTTHEDLAANMLSGWDVADNDNNPNPTTTSYDHGTHVSGCASAVSNNGLGVASLGYKTKIIPVKATTDPQYVTHGYEGVEWARVNGADVINMSWGGFGTSTFEQNIINAAYNAGIVLVAAAGNDDNSNVQYPAGYTNVIAVASTTYDDTKSDFSSYGTYVDISAPGSNIRSSVLGSTLSVTNTYGIASGTSMASPITAGLCGLMLGLNPNLTPTQVRNCLTSSADNISSVNPGYTGQLGAGRINAYKALQCVALTVTPYDAGINSINTPLTAICGTSFAPQVVLKNHGASTLTSVTIQYRVDNGTWSNYSWTGSLASLGTTTVTLPSVSTTAGSHTFTATTTSTLNTNQTDGNSGNNSQTVSFTAVAVPGQALPFTETFESNSFTTNGWTISNPNNGLTWEIVTTQGNTPGNKSARLPYYTDTAIGQRDAITTPLLNFTGYDTIKLRFDHAYRRYSANEQDSLIVYISTNCGGTWTRLLARAENGSGTFSTGTTLQSNFVPTAATDWCFGTTTGSACYELNLNAYKGNNGVLIKFEGVNDYGNNIYIDNINIIGTQSATAPVAQFSAQPLSVCQGESVSFTNQSTNSPTTYAWSFQGGTPANSNAANPTVSYTAAGTYNVTLTVSNGGGQNTITKTQYVTVLAKPDVTASYSPQTVCTGDQVTLTATGANSYQWSSTQGTSTGNNIQATINGTTFYSVIGTASNGCKDTVLLTVTPQIKPTASISAGSTNLCGISSTTLTASGGSSYTWSNSQTGSQISVSPTQTTTYVVTVSANGSSCTSTASVTVNVNSNKSTSFSNTTCSNTPYSFNGQQLTQSGVYTATYQAVNGCDSTVTLNLTVNQTKSTNISAQICNGKSYNFNGQQLTQAGNYTANYQTSAGCDSSVNLTLSVTNSINNNLTANICTGSSYAFNGQQLTQAGNYSATYQSQGGCDSIVNLTLNVHGPKVSNVTKSICTGSSYNFNGQQLTQAGNYSANLQSSFGCDSTVNLTLIVANSIVNNLNQAICNGNSYTFNGQQLTQAGNYTATYQTQGGCDSTVNLTLTVNNGASTSTTANICSGKSYNFNGQLLTQAGNYSATYQTSQGCDSVVTLALDVIQSPTPTVNQNGNELSTQIYNTYQWQLNGSDIQGANSYTYIATQNGTYTVVVTNLGGCEGISQSFNVTGVGIENIADIKYLLYPNPATTKLFVETITNASVAMYDYTGKLIEEEFTETGQIQFDISKLASAVYFIEIKAGNQSTRTRFTKL